MLVKAAHCVAGILAFFGGGGCIVVSMNIKEFGTMKYDRNATGVVTMIAPLELSFDYAFFDGERMRSGVWTTTDPFTNVSLDVAFASADPACSHVLNVLGQSGYSCGSITSRAWFWPILLTTGICAMCIGGTVFSQAMFYRVDHRPKSTDDDEGN